MRKAVNEPDLLGTLRRIGAAPPEMIELFDYVDDLLLWVKDAAGHYQWRRAHGVRPISDSGCRWWLTPCTATGAGCRVTAPGRALQAYIVS